MPIQDIVTANSAQPRLPRVPSHREMLNVNGREVEVMSIGEGDPVVFLHGFGANPTVYIKSLVGLARRGRHVIAPALPSFGRSEPLPLVRQNVGGVAAHIAATLDCLDPFLGPVDVVGHSFGGGVALRLAVTRPELVKSLTLICPVGGSGDGASQWHHVIRGILAGDAGKRWIFNGYRHFLPTFLRHTPSVVVTGLSAWFSDQLDDVRAVDRLDIPVRFIFAQDDRLVRTGQIPSLASDNVKVEVQHGRHSWIVGESDRFVEVVLGSANPDVFPDTSS